MPSKFVNLINQAVSENWCTKFGCTTCGAQDFRHALHTLDGGAVEALANVDLERLQWTYAWMSCTGIALWSVGMEGRSAVLRSWLGKVDRHIRVADAVLFYTIRNHEVEPSVKNAWVEKCKEMILRTDDTSLLESLIYTVEGDLEEDPLYERALQVAAERPSIATALSNVGLRSPF